MDVCTTYYEAKRDRLPNVLKGVAFVYSQTTQTTSNPININSIKNIDDNKS
jgi:hypothetical protein